MLVDQMLHREQVIARAGADSIEAFLELAGNSLILEARGPRIIEVGGNTQKELDNFIADWEDTPFVETILTDEEGEVLFVANREKTGTKTGVSVSDRDYFLAAKKAQPGEVFAGKPILPRLGAYEGQFLLPLATPVYKDNEFRGVLGMAILLSELNRTFLDPLKISQETKIHLVDKEGVFLATHIPELTGVNFFEYLEENPFPGSDLLIERFKAEFEKAVEKEEGKLVYTRNELADKTNLRQWLLAYSVIHLEGSPGQSEETHQHWILAVETPKEDALAFYPPFYSNQVAALVFVLFFILTIVMVLILALRMAKKESYLKGFAHGRDNIKERG